MASDSNQARLKREKPSRSNQSQNRIMNWSSQIRHVGSSKRHFVAWPTVNAEDEQFSRKHQSGGESQNAAHKKFWPDLALWCSYRASSTVKRHSYFHIRDKNQNLVLNDCLRFDDKTLNLRDGIDFGCGIPICYSCISINGTELNQPIRRDRCKSVDLLKATLTVPNRYQPIPLQTDLAPLQRGVENYQALIE